MARAAPPSSPKPSTAWLILRKPPAPCRARCSISYLADVRVRNFLMLQNPAAARAIAERLDTARRLGLWHPRRNDIDASLAAVRAEAAA